MARVALLTIHGLGEIAPDPAHGLRGELAARLGPKFAQVDFRPVACEDLLQAAQRQVWQHLQPQVGGPWDELRRFVLFGLADLVGLVAHGTGPGSVYEQVQLRIAQALLAAQRALDEEGAPVFVLSHSLGCQLLSSYLWDAQQARAGRAACGIWRDIDVMAPRLTGHDVLTVPELAFLRGDALHGWITTGCLMPVFLAAEPAPQVRSIAAPSADFKWLNFHDADDVLAWPLQALSPAYARLVEDRCLQAGQGGPVDRILRDWNPHSHHLYWEHDEVLNPLVKMLYECLR